MLRSPSAIVFNLVFPLVFITAFGFISFGGFSINVAYPAAQDMNHPVFKALSKIDALKLKPVASYESIQKSLAKGELDGYLEMRTMETFPVQTVIDIKSSASSPQASRLLGVLVRDAIREAKLDELTAAAQKNGTASAVPETTVTEQLVQGRPFKTIDFILPGQLGFSLLSAGVFGTAFIFISLRQQLVLKRFFATPVSRIVVLLGETCARLGYQLAGAVIILTVGHFVFGFTLANGVFTVLNMLALSLLGLIVFMGFGFIVSGLAKNESTVAPMANLFTLPQFLLGGTFFSVDAFPSWLQPISRALPLTYLNAGLRRIAFDGAALWEVWREAGVIAIWGVGVYIVAGRVFRWE